MPGPPNSVAGELAVGPPGGAAEQEVSVDVVWIDVSMWTGLSGRVQPFTDVECDPPEETPTSSEGWKDWALTHLTVLAEQDQWQPGRYHYTVEQRDGSGRQLEAFAQGVWEWRG